MNAPKTPETGTSFRDRCTTLLAEEAVLREGGGAAGLERQHKLGRLFARERVAALLDPASDFLEIGLWAAQGMYSEWGSFTAAGVVVGIGRVSGHPVMIVANDATVKAGAFVPMTCKKVLRAQRIAFECGLPLVYLVDSSGVFLPMQDEIFPDEDDFGRIFRNNAVISAAGLPQYAAIMGNCVAGGAYLPVLCDKILMTEGSGLYLAGPSLVKAAIGQETDSSESLGRRSDATRRCRAPSISGKRTDPACLKRLRSLIGLLPQEADAGPVSTSTERPSEDLYDLVGADGRKDYGMSGRCSNASSIPARSTNSKAEPFGKSLVCAYARLAGRPVGIVANQRVRVQSKNTGLQMPGVIYADSAEKAARFVMDCNQTRLPLLFLQDVSGFMVGKDAEQSGIIRSGAKLVNAVSNSTVPKITVVIGGSYGAGNYALCGKAFDPRFIFAWPNARYAVMGAAQASDVVFKILTSQREGSRAGGAGDAARAGEEGLCRSGRHFATARRAAGSIPSSSRTTRARCSSRRSHSQRGRPPRRPSIRESCRSEP